MRLKTDLDFFDSGCPLHVVAGQMCEPRRQYNMATRRQSTHRAVVRCHERPQKKKKKKMTHYRVSMLHGVWSTIVRRTYFEVTDQGVSDRVGIESVLEDCGRDVRQTRENNDT